MARIGGQQTWALPERLSTCGHAGPPEYLAFQPETANFTIEERKEIDVLLDKHSKYLVIQRFSFL